MIYTLTLIFAILGLTNANTSGDYSGDISGSSGSFNFSKLVIGLVAQHG